MPLTAWGIGAGDAVFVPSFTFAATAKVIVLIGATPVFTDVLPDAFNLNPANLKAAIHLANELGLRLSVVIPVVYSDTPRTMLREDWQRVPISHSKWSDITKIIYNLAISVAAINSFMKKK